MRERKQIRFNTTSIKTHNRTLILGTAGTGKSVLFDTLLKMLSKKTLIVLIDSKQEYNHIPNFDLDVLTKKKIGIYRIYELTYKNNTITDLKIITEFIADLLFNSRKSNCMLAVEELSQCNFKQFNLSAKQPNLSRIITAGRSRNIGFIATSQRPQHISTEILSQATDIISFNVYSKHDKKAMEIYLSLEDYMELAEYNFRFWYISLANQTKDLCYKLRPRDMGKELKYYRQTFGSDIY